MGEELRVTRTVTLAVPAEAWPEGPTLEEYATAQLSAAVLQRTAVRVLDVVGGAVEVGESREAEYRGQLWEALGSFLAAYPEQLAGNPAELGRERDKLREILTRHLREDERLDLERAKREAQTAELLELLEPRRWG